MGRPPPDARCRRGGRAPSQSSTLFRCGGTPDPRHHAMRFDPMTLQFDTFKSLVKEAAEKVIASAPELTALDQAIGDGDHGTNMKRGFEAVLSKLDTISAQPLDEAFKTIGKTLVMTVGGASGPLYGSFFLAAGEALSGKRVSGGVAAVFCRGVKPRT